MSTRYYVSRNKKLRAALVNVPNRSWRYAQRAELRVRDVGDNRPLTGHGCYDGSRVYVDLDSRYLGPRSYTGSLLRELGLL